MSFDICFSRSAIGNANSVSNGFEATQEKYFLVIRDAAAVRALPVEDLKEPCVDRVEVGDVFLPVKAFEDIRLDDGALHRSSSSVAIEVVGIIRVFDEIGYSCAVCLEEVHEEKQIGNQSFDEVGG